MQPYNDVDGDSNVAAYDVGPDYIRVQFVGGATYLYTYARLGAYDVEQMKQLAERGEGLNSYINRRVARRYERKEH